MNAVDTGWINDENPLEKAAEIAQQHNFQTPIDEACPLVAFVVSSLCALICSYALCHVCCVSLDSFWCFADVRLKVDAAARVLDPVFVGGDAQQRHVGMFFKDYAETEW